MSTSRLRDRRTARADARGIIAQRDLVVDLIRTACVVLVVIVHVTMVGVAADDAGHPGHEPTAGARLVRRRHLGRPGDAAVLRRRRVRERRRVAEHPRPGRRCPRLRGDPAGPAVPARRCRCSSCSRSGSASPRRSARPPDLLAEVAFGIGSPLWFLAAYGITQCCVPLMARLHERARGARSACCSCSPGRSTPSAWPPGSPRSGCSTSVRCGSSRSSSASSGRTAGSRAGRRRSCSRRRRRRLRRARADDARSGCGRRTCCRTSTRRCCRWRCWRRAGVSGPARARARSPG